MLLISRQTSLMLHGCAVMGKINCSVAFSKWRVLPVLIQIHHSSMLQPEEAVSAGRLISGGARQ